MPKYDFRAPRLFVDAPLRAGETVPLERDQSNYLGNVLRLATGETILVFNGRDGEWQATITGRKRADQISVIGQTRPQDRLPDLAYAFAPVIKLVAQRSNADAQQVRRMRSIATRLAQGVPDVFFLNLLERDDFRRKSQQTVWVPRQFEPRTVRFEQF